LRPHPPPPGHEERYSYGRTLEVPFATALERARAGLRREGFSILFEIDLRAKLREKLGVDVPDYAVLGACSPLLSHRALLQDMDVGLLVSSTLVVYSRPDGRTAVKAIDAIQLLSITGNEALESPADELNERLHKVIDEL
jgi:uncharacterized protein (DUF302 family)